MNELVLANPQPAKASRREVDRAFSCPIIVRSYREELPRAYSNRARINRPVRPYSGHYALTVDCKFPSQPIGRQLENLRLWTSDPPPDWRSTRLKPKYHSRAVLRSRGGRIAPMADRGIVARGIGYWIHRRAKITGLGKTSMISTRMLMRATLTISETRHVADELHRKHRKERR